MDRFNKNANIPNIEDFLWTELRGGELGAVTIGFFPKVLQEEVDDSITMIDVADSIDYSQQVVKLNVYLWLCAKNEGNTKNSALLKSMENSLDMIIESFQDEDNEYMLSKLRAQAEYIDDVDYSCNRITIQVTVL